MVALQTTENTLLFLAVMGFGMTSTACMGMGYQLVSYVPEMIRAGVGVVEGLENVDVRAALAPEVSREEISKVKRVAVVMGTQARGERVSVPFVTASGDFVDVMADNIALELLNLGFHVIERASLDKVLKEQGIQLSDITDPSTAAKVGKILGVDALVLGNVIVSQKTQVRTGFFGYGSDMATAGGISDATMRLVGVERANVLLIVTLSYKKGQKPSEAAKTMAIALSQKIKDPTPTTVSK